MGFVSGIMVILAMMLPVLLVCGAAVLVQAIGLYVIARRRGIRKPWLAWLPIANLWILGSISDQYQYLAKGCVKNRRKLLTALHSAAMAGMLLLEVLSIMQSLRDTDPGVLFIVCLVLMFVGCFAAVASVLVLRLLTMHDLYASCDPDKSVVFLVLSIFLMPFYPFFILACCRKDLGMPQRKPSADPEP